MARAAGTPCAMTVLVAVAVAAASPETASAETQDAAQPAPTPSSSMSASGAGGTTVFQLENTTRAELWRYFQPPLGGAPDPEYTFFGSRSKLGATYDGLRWRLRGALQYVRLENLPTGAIGPGLLGTGATYYFQAAGAYSYQFYLRSLSLRWQGRSHRTWVELGRFSRGDDVVATGDAEVDRVAHAELAGRLLGDMEWSFYQRAWDGVRAGGARGGVAVAMTGAVPTQGTYEESANLFMDRVKVAAVEASVAPGRLVPRTRVDVFAITYDDTRRVTGRPDNTAGLIAHADVHVRTFGASAAGVYPTAWGRAEVVGWTAGQIGSWFEQQHRAWAATTTIAHRFDRGSWRPRVRAGVAYASGDGQPFDRRHGTFFPLLPSGDRVSALNAYALMNVRDIWASADASPTNAIDVQLGAHRVHLAEVFDQWYQGSGGTTRSGAYFGFQGRRSSGSRDLGSVVEGTVSWRPRRWWTLRTYVGRMSGGDVVAGLFRADLLLTAWLESTVRF